MGLLERAADFLLPLVRGRDELYLVPGMRELLAKHVRAAERLSKIEEHADQYEATIHTLQKKAEALTESLHDLSVSRESTRQEMQAVLNELLETRRQIMSSIVDYRILAQSLVTPLEWENIRIAAKDRARRVWEERQSKIKDWNDTREKLDEVIRSTVPEPGRAGRISASLLELWNRMAEMRQEANVNPTKDDALKLHGVTLAELSRICDGVSELRRLAHAAYLDFHFTLVENTNEEEWKKISKHIKF